MMYLALFCHDELSPFAQLEECLSVSKLFGVPQIAMIRRTGFNNQRFEVCRALLVRVNPTATSAYLTQHRPAGLQGFSIE
jgi:hypothetical protein